jgi:hypothetical protein
MAQSSWPWDGVTDGDAALLAPYDEQEWDDNERMLFGAGGNCGVLANPYGLNHLEVTERGAGANMSVDVDTGAALVYGKRYKNTAAVNLTIAANASGNPRIDRVVAVWNRQAVAYTGVTPNISPKTCRLAVLQGTPAASPTAPALTQTAATVYMIPLAQVAVANGAASILSADITDEREFARFTTQRTRHMFVPALVGNNITDGTEIPMTRDNGGVIHLPDNKVAGTYGRFVADTNMSKVVSRALFLESTGGAVYAHNTARHAAIGEDQSTNTATTGMIAVDTVAGVEIWNTHALLEIPDITAGEIVRLWFQRDATNALDTINASIAFVGWMVSYTGDN